MAAELVAMATLCDGVRCDMAMLLLPDVFLDDLGPTGRSRSDVSDARRSGREAIRGARPTTPEFVFMAEAYWGTRAATPAARLRLHLRQDDSTTAWSDATRPASAATCAPTPTYQARSVRFLENHDEPRAAATFAGPEHRAAAVLTYLVPGLRFVYDGQIEGRTARASIHLARFRDEPVDADLATFYRKLMLVAARPECAWAGSNSSIAILPGRATRRPSNSSPSAARRKGRSLSLSWSTTCRTRGLCRVKTGLPGIDGRTVRLSDLLGDVVYHREGDDLAGTAFMSTCPSGAFTRSRSRTEPRGRDVLRGSGRPVLGVPGTRRASGRRGSDPPSPSDAAPLLEEERDARAAAAVAEVDGPSPGRAAAPGPLSPPAITQPIPSRSIGPRSSSSGSTESIRRPAGADRRCSTRGRPCFRSSTLTPHQMWGRSAAKRSGAVSMSRSRSDRLVRT